MAAKFHERFEIEVGVKEAQRRFTARVDNLVFAQFIGIGLQARQVEVVRYIASILGDRYTHNYLGVLSGAADFHRHLQAVEALYAYVGQDRYEAAKQAQLTETVLAILDMSETDIGVRWESGHFIPEGARLLDDKLVNDPLRWLRARGHANVLNPYEKGLEHLLQSQKNPALLSDVVTDMYEALEALAKVTTGREADLSANRELFISKVKVSDAYKRLLREYIEYANDFRHAAEQGTVRPTPSAAEVEGFVYLTGTFIRLAMS